MSQQVLDKHVSALTAVLSDEELERMTSYTLADAMREGCKVTGHKVGGWYDDETACALSSALIAAKARGWL